MFGNISAFQIDSGRIYFAKGKTRFSSIEFLAFDTADYNEKDPASLIRALSDIASKHDISGSKMVTTLPAHNIIMKNFSFPFSDKSMIDEVVLLEAEENIPVEIDTLYHSHQILHKSSSQTEVLFCACEKTVCDSIANSFAESGHSLSDINLEANALYHLLRFSENNTNETIYHVDFGHDRIIINILKNNLLVYTRCILQGWSSAFEKLSPQNKNSTDELERVGSIISENDPKSIREKLAKKLKITSKTAEKRVDSYYDVLDKQSKLITASIKNYEKSQNGHTPEKIFLSGNSSYTQYFADSMFKSLETPVYELSASSVLKNSKVGNEYNIAAGLVISQVFASGQINLIRTEKGSFQSPLDAYRLPVAFTAAGVAILLLYFLISISVLAIKGSSNEKLLAVQYKQLFRKDPQKNDVVAEAGKLLEAEKKQLTSYNIIIPKDHSMLANLEDILKSFSSDPSFIMKDITMTDKQVQINGESADTSKIDDFKSKLQQTGRYSSVDRNTYFSGKAGSKFSIVIKIKERDSSQK